MHVLKRACTIQCIQPSGQSIQYHKTSEQHKRRQASLMDLCDLWSAEMKRRRG